MSPRVNHSIIRRCLNPQGAQSLNENKLDRGPGTKQEVVMRSKGHHHMPHVIFAVLTFALTFIGPSTTWAGPYLRTSSELSIARSTKECGEQVAKALNNLQKKGYLRVDPKNRRLGVTKESTIYVECIFVGQNQWIFHISIASTNWAESGKLLGLLRDELGRFVRID